MPDGDIVHPLLSPRYQGLYQQVCEGQFDEEALAHKALYCLKREVEDFGDEPLHLIAREAALFEAIFLQLQQGQEVDWVHERRKLKQLRRYIDGHGRALDLVVKACEQQLRDLEMNYHYRITPADYQWEITRKYLIAVYDAQFEKRAGQLRRPHSQADPEFVRQRLSALRPGVIKGVEYYVDQIVQKGTFGDLRRPRRPKRMIDINEDLDKDLSELLR